MVLKNTIQQMETLLNHINNDMAKVHRGNSAAAQRVRTATIKLEKVAKKFRKESVAAGKKKRVTGKKVVKKAATKKKAAPKKRAAAKRKAAPKRTTATRRRVSARTMR